MARQEVTRSAIIDRSASTIWAHVRDFCTPWHPLIDRMTAEQGGAVRVFSVQGEDTVYRERLTWFSDTDRSMGYVHLEGIAGADHYAGRLRVEPTGIGACRVTMSAEIEAGGDRLSQIAKGTATIFDTGLEALAISGDSPLPGAPEAPSTVETKTLLLDTTPALALDLTPDRGGTPCLFLHGIGGNRGNWSGQLGSVGAVTQAAALDLRGYGDSALGRVQTTLDDYFDDIMRVADRLGAERLVLCGLSYGAWIATAFAERHPERLAGLVLSGGCTGMSEADADERAAFRQSREVPLDAGQQPADFAPAVVEVIAGPHATPSQRAELQASMAAIPADTYRDALRCFTTPPGRFDFSRLTMPVLMMTGEHDRLAPPTEIRSVAERIHAANLRPDVRFEVVEGAGHVCNLEAPARFNAPLLAFLERVAR